MDTALQIVSLVLHAADLAITFGMLAVIAGLWLQNR